MRRKDERDLTDYLHPAPNEEKEEEEEDGEPPQGKRQTASAPRRPGGERLHGDTTTQNSDERQRDNDRDKSNTDFISLTKIPPRLQVHSETLKASSGSSSVQHSNRERRESAAPWPDDARDRLSVIATWVSGRA